MHSVTVIQPVSVLNYLQHIRYSLNGKFSFGRGREVRLKHLKMCQIPHNPSVSCHAKTGPTCTQPQLIAECMSLAWSL